MIILAAGNSSRLGQSKQLVRFKGDTLLNNAITNAVSSKINQVVVVLGADAEAHKVSLNTIKNIHVVTNDSWELGMGNSIKFGLSSILEHEPDIDGVIISVCDQPFLSASVFDTLITTAISNPTAIVISKYNNGDHGVPVYFPATMFRELAVIPDESGAKALTKKYNDKLRFVDFDRGSTDIDTQEDLRNILKGL